MNPAASLRARLALPAIAAPMFLVSGAELVTACCKAGIAGTFPSHNGRTAADLEALLTRIKTELADVEGAAPFGVNVIIHRSNPRAQRDLELCIRHETPLIITSLGKPSKIVEAVHAYGGLVFSDVTTIEFARKAAEAGVDGLVLVCAGAGGHAGTLSPFAFVPAVRAFFDGAIAVAGAVTDGHGIKACEALGADFAYMGTRFLATVESGAAQAHKEMVVASSVEDLVYTAVVTGVPAHFLRASLKAAGYEVSNPDAPRVMLNMAEPGKAWRDAWSAGHGVGAIHDVPPAADLIARLKAEYARA